MENGKFKVTSDKVDDLVIRLSKDYPDISITDIKRFFGSGCGNSWQFEEDWFPNDIDYNELSDSFATWAYDELTTDLAYDELTTEKGKKLNEEFNEVYDAISDAYDKLNMFYMKHCALGQNDIENTRMHFDVVCLFDKLGNCKENAHEIAEYFTWDN